jgi:hypothetical protein
VSPNFPIIMMRWAIVLGSMAKHRPIRPIITWLSSAAVAAAGLGWIGIFATLA